MLSWWTAGRAGQSRAASQGRVKQQSPPTIRLVRPSRLSTDLHLHSCLFLHHLCSTIVICIRLKCCAFSGCSCKTICSKWFSCSWEYSLHTSQLDSWLASPLACNMCSLLCCLKVANALVVRIKCHPVEPVARCCLLAALKSAFLCCLFDTQLAQNVRNVRCPRFDDTFLISHRRRDVATLRRCATICCRYGFLARRSASAAAIWAKHKADIACWHRWKLCSN